MPNILTKIGREAFRMNKRETFRFIRHFKSYDQKLLYKAPKYISLGFNRRGFYQRIFRTIGEEAIRRKEKEAWNFSFFRKRKRLPLSEGEQFLKFVRYYHKNYKIYKNWQLGEFDIFYHFYGLITKTYAGAAIYKAAETGQLSYEEAYEFLYELARKLGADPLYIKGSTDIMEYYAETLEDLKARGVDLTDTDNFVRDFVQVGKFYPYATIGRYNTVIKRRIFLKQSLNKFAHKAIKFWTSYLNNL